MQVTQDEIEMALSNGLWMIRTDYDGKSHGVFRWQPIGEWTTCPKWSTVATCEGGGLFGQGPGEGEHGYAQAGTRVTFCITAGGRKSVNGDKVAVERAAIVAVDDDALRMLRDVCTEWPGPLYLRGCTGLTALPEGLSVGGSLDLYGCTGLTALPEGLSVGRWLDLRGCTGLTKIPRGLATKVVR